MAPRDALRGAIAGLAAALALAYPVRSFLVLEGLPWWARVSWCVTAVAAWRWPRPSILAFLAGAPLLPVVPSLLGWPPVALPSLWLLALLVPAWLRVVIRPRGGIAWPRAAALLLLIATASMVVTLSTLYVPSSGPVAVLSALHDYAWTDLILTTPSQPTLLPVTTWAAIAEGLALLWLVLSACGTPGTRPARTLAATSVAMAVGAAGVGAWAIEQWWTRDRLLQFWVEQDPHIVRVNASFTDVNALGAYLASMVALVVAVSFLRPGRAWRAAWAVATLGVLAGTVFTGSRAAWFAAVVALAVLVAGALVWCPGPWSAATLRRLRVAAAAAAVVLVAGLAASTVWATVRDVRYAHQRSYLDTLLFTLNLKTPPSERLKGRVDLWRAAVRMIEARPATGIGLGRYYSDVGVWSPEREAFARPEENAHNYFLQVGAELGAPALACLVWLFGAAAFGGFQAARSPGPSWLRRIALGTSSGVVAFTLTSLSGHSLLLHEGQLTFWALAGLGMAAPNAVRGLGAGPHRGRGSWLVPAAAAVLVLTLPWRTAAETGGDLPRAIQGFYAEERGKDGRAFRWTGTRAILPVPATARVLMLEIRSLAPVPQHVELRLGDSVEQVSLDAGGWLPLRYVLPIAASPYRYRRLDLRVTPTWSPRGDARALGVMVSGVEWR